VLSQNTKHREVGSTSVQWGQDTKSETVDGVKIAPGEVRGR